MPTLAEQVQSQGELVRKLKSEKADKKEIKAAVDSLLTFKKQAEAEAKANPSEKDEAKEFRSGLEDLLVRKFFYVPSFEIYRGVGGLYDFGPPGCAMKANILAHWRQHFILTESMLEVSCSTLTPEIVLKTSGHVDKFTDFMVKDVKTGDCHRADKILEDHIDTLVETATAADRLEMLSVRSSADAFDQKELGNMLTKYAVKAPVTGNDISTPFPFNLMFQTSIGPTGKLTGYMRPETAQGIFVNFRRLLEYNGGRMPFAAAQVGLAFRNEISPRSGLLRVREFDMAEIEHFVDPDSKDHPKFKNVANYPMSLLAKADQTGEDVSRIMTVGDAVANGTIDNQTLGYFMARTHKFLIKIGIDSKRLRFRQHKDTEMAHYASDCWDAEIHCTYGWIECVGHADRSAYDLKVHSDKSKTDLSAQIAYDEPRVEEVVDLDLNNGIIGKKFKKEAKTLTTYLKEMSKEKALQMKADLEKGEAVVRMCGGEEYKISSDMVKIGLKMQKISVKKFIPNVIEPSFGIGRIMYCLLEHSYRVIVKNGEKQGILALVPSVAPVKVAILPFSTSDEMEELLEILESSFVRLGLATKVDTSGASIGRKYARADEIGVPFSITIDFDSIEKKDVTIRERDSTNQIRVPIKEAPKIIAAICKGTSSWADAYSQGQKFTV